MAKTGLFKYIKEGITFKKSITNHTITAILEDGREGTGFSEKAALESAHNCSVAGICAHCGLVITNDNMYYNFAGDNLHVFCLTEFTKKLGILKTILPQTHQ